jgi:hypothetical protein
MNKTKLLSIFLILALFLFNSCVKQDFFAGEDSLIEISAEKINIEFNESTKIFIVGYNSDGSLLWDETRVDFSVENGTLNKSYVKLDNGHAELIATGNINRGEMKITARSGKIEANPLTINVGNIPEVSQILVSLAPSILPPGGGTCKITINIYDKYYVPIQDISVLLESDYGNLASKGGALITDNSGRVIDYLDTDRESIITIYAGNAEPKEVTVSVEEEKENQIPVAVFNFSPVYPESGETVYFNASESYDNDGNITRYSWDFGDGSSGGGLKPTHVYDTGSSSYKTFTITLTV